MKLKVLLLNNGSLDMRYVDERHFKRYIKNLYINCIGSTKKFITCKQMKKEIKFIFRQSVINSNVMLHYIKEVS